MQQSLKGIATGTASGVLTFGVSMYTVGYATSLAMPRGFPHPLWEASVVLGLGAALVAFLIHFFSIRFLAARITPAFVAFAVTVIGIVALSGLLAFLYKPLLAWLVGALLASAIQHWLRPNNSFKPNPLRGSA